jgi:hypothetical protein
MLRRFGTLGTFLILGLVSCFGQLCQTSHQSDLYCIVPNVFQVPGTTVAPQFTARILGLYTPFVITLGQLPIAKPAGVILKLQNGLLKPTNESLGPVFSERAQTIGRERLFFGSTYQHFIFRTIDGTDLKNVPIVIQYPLIGQSQFFAATNDRFDFKASQYTFLAAYGVTDKLDVSMALPIETVAVAADINGNVYLQNSNVFSPITKYTSGRSSGIGDLVFGAKATVMDLDRFSIATGLDLRLPTGDELNFRGTGAVGVKPYLAVSKHGQFSPRINLGLQVNGASIVDPDSSGNKQRLPTDFFYTIGADAGLSPRVTFVADLLGNHVFSAPRLSPSAPATENFANSSLASTPQTVTPYISSYTTLDLSIGAKGKLSSHLVATGNVLVKLNNAGARANFVPLIGLSYSF